ncbi:MAG: DUF4388 domain-containing protein [Planctomycetes bacterium]|nr:DUF4388 domain-containing protein [Planctomycetota bacterium]
MPNAIVLEEDSNQRMLLKALLEGGGFQVEDAGDARSAQDLVRGSRARIVIARGASFGSILNELRLTRPEVEILEPSNYAAALVEGAVGRDLVATFARDVLQFLVNLVEDHTGVEPSVERIVRMTELSARHLGLGRIESETAAVVATLAALGPHLARFRFGGDAPVGADAGLSRSLHAALAAAAFLRSPYPLAESISALEERLDGSGRPSGLIGSEIPVAARLASISLAYSELIGAGIEESLVAEALRDRAGLHFDPLFVDAFFKALRDERYVERMAGGQSGVRILVAHPDASALTISELRLSAAGFVVEACSDGAEAFEKITSEPHPAAVIASTVLPKLDGISLLLKLRRHPTAKKVPVVFVTSQTDPGLIKKSLALGAKDVLAEPINYDVLAAKLQTMTQGAATQQTAVAGNLAEMPLTDFFQVLALGRKTARIQIESNRLNGEVFFEDGQPVAALTADGSGVEAFCNLVMLNHGSFRLFPAQHPEEKNLTKNLDALLLHVAWLEDERDRDDD